MTVSKTYADVSFEDIKEVICGVPDGNYDTGKLASQKYVTPAIICTFIFTFWLNFTWLVRRTVAIVYNDVTWSSYNKLCK